MKKIICIIALLCTLVGCSQKSTDFQIELDETNGSWTYEVNKNDIVDIDEVQESNVSDGNVSTLNGKEIYTIHGKKEGKVKITFTYDENNLTAVYTLEVDSNNNVTETKHSGSYFKKGMDLTSNEEVSEKEMVKETNIDLPTTKEMTDIYYSVLDLNGTKISQMDFTLDNQKYCYRAVYTDVLTLDEVQDISGMGNNRVGISEDYTIQSCSARAYDRGDGSGYIIWMDTDAGIVYTLSMKENVDTSLLAQIASTIYTAQGEK